MGQALQNIVDHFVNRAKRSPAPQIILRDAAQTIARLAMNPKNARMQPQLHAVAMEFAQAASKRQATSIDFTEQLRERAAAIAEVGDADTLDVMAREREIAEQRSPTGGHQVSIAPASINEDTPLGRSTNLAADPTDEQKNNGVTQTATVAFWQGRKQEAQAVTVDTNFVFPPQKPPAAGNIIVPLVQIIRPYGIVEYGSDGNRTSVKYDIGFGTRFTVVGNYVSVLVGMDPIPPDPYIDEEITLGASIGMFSAPSIAPVTLTLYIQVNAGATSDIIFRPTRAVELLPIQSNLALGETADLSFYPIGGLGAPALYTAQYQKAANNPMKAIPLGNDMGSLEIKNNGAGTGTFRLPFLLSL